MTLMRSSLVTCETQAGHVFMRDQQTGALTDVPVTLRQLKTIPAHVKLHCVKTSAESFYLRVVPGSCPCRMLKHHPTSQLYTYSEQFATPSNKASALCLNAQHCVRIPFLTIQPEPTTFMSTRRAQNEQRRRVVDEIIFHLSPVLSQAKIPTVLKIIRSSSEVMFLCFKRKTWR